MNTPNRITLTLRAAEGQTLEQIDPYAQSGAHVSIGRGLAVIDRVVRQEARGEEPELVAYHCVDEYGQKKVLLPGAEGIGRHIRRGSVLKQLTYMDSACRLQAEVERLNTVTTQQKDLIQSLRDELTESYSVDGAEKLKARTAALEGLLRDLRVRDDIPRVYLNWIDAALAEGAKSDPQGCNECTHPECGRYEGPQKVECRAMADNACARPTAEGAKS